MDDRRGTHPAERGGTRSRSLSDSSLRTFFHRPFVRNLARLTGATTFGGAIALAVSPLLTRLYSPADFGVLGVFVTALLVVSVVASLRYDLGIPYPSDEQEAADLLVLALGTIGVTAFAGLVLVSVGTTRYLPLLKHGLPRPLHWLLPIGMWASATYASLSIWMIRRQDFRTLGITKITQGVMQAVTQILLGFLGYGAGGLIVGQIAGSSGGWWRLWRRIRKDNPDIIRHLDRQRLKATALAYKRFPLLSAPAVLCDALTGAMPVIFIAAHFGAVATGLFTLVQRVISVPLALLTVNLGQVVFGDLAELRRQDPHALAATFRRRVFQIAILGLALFLPLVLLVPIFLAPIFGSRWAEAGTYFVLLSPMLYAAFVSSPFGFVIDVLRRQDLHLLRDVTRVAFTAAALGVAAATDATIPMTLGLISLAGTIGGLFYLAVSWHAITSHHNALNGQRVSASDAAAMIHAREATSLDMPS